MRWTSSYSRRIPNGLPTAWTNALHTWNYVITDQLTHLNCALNDRNHHLCLPFGTERVMGSVKISFAGVGGNVSGGIAACRESCSFGDLNPNVGWGLTGNCCLVCFISIIRPFFTDWFWLQDCLIWTYFYCIHNIQLGLNTSSNNLRGSHRIVSFVRSWHSAHDRCNKSTRGVFFFPIGAWFHLSYIQGPNLPISDSYFLPYL
jgi:hypothetical protein